MKKVFLSSLLLLILPLNCKPNNSAKSPEQILLDQKIKTICQSGCENLFDLKCFNYKPINICTNSCIAMENNSSNVMDSKCLAAIISCDEIEACRK